MAEYRVFFSKDCSKFGVQRFGNLWGDCMGDRWQQVALKDKAPYTAYKKVAERWLKDLKKIYQ